jgi:hypothetical protein
MDVIMNDKFWFEDPNILFNQTRLVEFIPLPDHTIEELLNSIFRFSIYISILMYVFKRRILMFLLPVFVSAVTFYVYYRNKEYIDPKDDNSFPCLRPSSTNPLMNILVSDYGDNQDRKKACDSFHVKKDIQKYINRTRYRNSFDVLEDEFSERPYYTTAITTIPNNQEDFANWLYKEKDTCKTNIRYCYAPHDIRNDRGEVD